VQLATLPDHLCYSTIQIESPTGKTINLPRRDLSDIRVQLMAEDEAANDETLNDIEDSDIRTGVYEGGFKTWECSVDLASILLDRGPRKDIDELFKCDQIVEVLPPIF
jgi:protein-histidine N-methyltransferase